MVKKFIIHLMSLERGVFTHEVNCANAFSASVITAAIHPNARIIEIKEME